MWFQCVKSQGRTWYSVTLNREVGKNLRETALLWQRYLCLNVCSFRAPQGCRLPWRWPARSLCRCACRPSPWCQRCTAQLLGNPPAPAAVTARSARLLCAAGNGSKMCMLKSFLKGYVPRRRNAVHVGGSGMQVMQCCFGLFWGR